MSLFLDENNNSRLEIHLAEFEKLIVESGSRRSMLTRELRDANASLDVPGIGLMTEIGGKRFLCVPNMGRYAALVYEIDLDRGVLRRAESMQRSDATGRE